MAVSTEQDRLRLSSSIVQCRCLQDSGVGLGYFLTGKLGRAWVVHGVVHGWCLGVHGCLVVVMCWGFLQALALHYTAAATSFKEWQYDYYKVHKFNRASLIHNDNYLSRAQPGSIHSGPEEFYYQLLPPARKESRPGSNKNQKIKEKIPGSGQVVIIIDQRRPV